MFYFFLCICVKLMQRKFTSNKMAQKFLNPYS